MRLRFALSLIFLVVCATSLAQERRAFVLAPSKGGAQLLHQCSRQTPQGAEGFWTPSSQNITTLEGLLEKFLTTDASGKSVLPLTQYHRQYAGYIRGGKRYIYGNFYRAPTMLTSEYDEATQPVIICDGGRSFWGIVFSVGSGSFVDLAFNSVK
jgi:hypothetical protein